MNTHRPCKFARYTEGTDPHQFDGMSSREVARAVGVAQNTVLAHTRGTCGCNRDETPIEETSPVTDTPESIKAHLELGPDGGTFDSVITTAPITTWDHVFEKFGLDPNEFEIANDTVRMAAWDGAEGETRYSYRATFRRAMKADTSHVENLIAHVRDFVPQVRPQPEDGIPVTAVIGLADWQLGKGEGDGTLGTIERITAALSAACDWIEHATASGYRIEEIVLANLGDHTEATHGSYSNQPATVDLNLRDQINLAIDLNLKWIKAMREYAPVHYAACLCNHGQLSRVGHDPVMGDADNATGLIGDQLHVICKHVPGLQDVRFTIPQDEMITKVVASGVNVAMAHGHKISGKEETWLAQQSAALTHRENFIPELWLTAHKHHANIVDLGPYTRIQATTEDPGSKWLYDSKGLYSTPGTTVVLVSKALPMKWDLYRVLQ